MFNPGKLKIKVGSLDNNLYSLAVVSEEGRFLDTTHIRRLLFTWDDASFYGTKINSRYMGRPSCLYSRCVGAAELLRAGKL